MAQLKVKQISDFVSAVGGIHDATVGTAAGTAIAGVQSDVDANAEAIALNTAKVGITTEQSSAIVANSAKVGITEAQSSAIVANTSGIAAESARIDALLLDSTEALDTFAEIETFITGLSTADVSQLEALSTAVSNDAVHAAGISANATAIANLDLEIDNLDFTMDLSLTADALQNDVSNTNGTGVTLSGATEELAGLMTAEDFSKLRGVEASADVTDSVNVRAAGALMDDEITNLSQVKAFDSSDYATAAQGLLAASALQDADAFDASGSATAAQSAAISEAGRLDAIVLSSAKSYADTAEADAIASANSHTDTEIAALDSRIDGLEGASFEEVVANFVDITGFSSGVQFNLDNVKVFVNGLQIHEAGEGIDGWRSGDGLNFTVEGLGYDLEADDHIIVSGRLA